MKKTKQQDERKQLSQWAIAICGLVFTLIIADILGDYQEGIAWRHIVIEVGMLLLSLTGIVYFGWFYYQATQLTINLLEKMYMQLISKRSNGAKRTESWLQDCQNRF